MGQKDSFSRAAAFALLLTCAAPATAISFLIPQHKKDAAACAAALERGDYSAAIAAGRKSVDLEKDYFDARYCLGKAYAKAGMAARGIEQLRAALPLAETPNHTMVVNSDLGQLLQKEKEYVKALEHYDTALAYAIVTRDQRTRGLTLANIASVFREQGNDVKALEYYRRAVGEGEAADSGAAWNNMGNILFAKNDFAGALDAYTRAAALGEGMGDDLLAGIALLNAGNVMVAKKDFPAAETKLSEGLARTRKAGNKFWEAAANEYFGRLHAAAGDMAKAKEFFGGARDKYRANRNEYEAQQMEMRLREIAAAGPANAAGAPGAVGAEPLPR